MVTNTVQKSEQLVFALDVVQQSGRIAMEYLIAGVEYSIKNDGTPVTAADKQCERLIREAINKRFPEDGILGEEEGETQAARKVNGSRGSRKWLIDPIDGTYNYTRKIPVFATLLALEEDGEIILGVVHAPAAGDTYWAEKNCGAYKNGSQIAMSTVGSLSQAHFLYGEPDRILHNGYQPGLERAIAGTARQRAFGDYLNYAYVFEGKAEAVLEVGVKPWDLAPMKVLAEEAGGRFSDLEGGGSIYTGSCVVSNGLVHDEILKLLHKR